MTIKRLLFIVSLLVMWSVPLHAQTWGTLNADAIVRMNTSSPGTTATAAIADAGTVCGGNCTIGTNVGFALSGGPGFCSGCFSVGAYQNTGSNLGPIQLTNGGTLYPAQSQNFNNLAHSDINNSNAYWNFSGTPGSKSQVSTIVLITLGPPLQTSSGADWDILGTWEVSAGDYWEAQLNNKCVGSSANYGIRIEDKPTAHSLCIPLAAQGSYWISQEVNVANGYSSLEVYSENGSFMGSISHISGTNGSTLRYIQFGNNESGTNGGATATEYQNLMVNFSNPGFLSGSSATVTNGSPTVTGITGCTSAWNGMSIKLPNSSVATASNVSYNVQSCISSTSLTLTSNYSGTTVTGTAAWEFHPSYFWTNTAPNAGIIAPARVTSWTGVGVPGGVPNRTTACSTLTSTATSAQINSAISSCTPGDYVSLGAGTYSNATGCISFGGMSNVTLRGAGANQTVLAPTSTSGCGASLSMSGSGITGGGGVSGSTVQGSTTITVATGATTLLVGNPLMFDMLDPTCDNGGIFESGTGSGYTCTATSPGVGGPYNLDGGTNALLGSGCSSASPSSCYHQQQIVTVTSCNGVSTVGTQCSGSNVVVGFTPGLQMPNWTPATMRAWWYTSPVLSDGLEDLSLDTSNTSGAIGIEMAGCQGCWVKGIASLNTAEAHIQLLHVNQSTIENNYFFLTQNSQTLSYGVECYSCTDNLIVNNIFHAVTTPMISNGPSIANAWVYNYAINEYYTSAGNVIPAYGGHASATQMNLIEGNIINSHTADTIHGTGNMETFFRNQMSVQPACYSSGSSYATAVYSQCTNGYWTAQDQSFHRFHNYVGNILGATGVNTVYQGTSSACTTGSPCVYEIGVSPSGTPNDPNVLATILRWGNADSANGFGSPRFLCSEVPVYLPSGTLNSAITPIQYPYQNACPFTNTLPASLLYSSTPSWWPTGKAWPIIGPDVTGGNLLLCNSGAQIRSLVTNSSQCPGGSTSTAVNGLAYSNPAMDCYLSLGGLPNGTGPQLTNFNEAGCYTGGTPQASTPTCAPGSGTYTSAQTVTCSTASSGAIMCYTTNGATPVTNGGSACSVGTLYATSILVSGSETVTIVAGGAGFSDSSAAVYTYIIQPAISAPAAPMLAMIGKLQ